MTDTCQLTAKKEVLIISLAISGINFTIEEQRNTTRSLKEAFHEISVSELSSFVESLQLVRRTY